MIWENSVIFTIEKGFVFVHLKGNSELKLSFLFFYRLGRYCFYTNNYILCGLYNQTFSQKSFLNTNLSHYNIKTFKDLLFQLFKLQNSHV